MAHKHFFLSMICYSLKIISCKDLFVSLTFYLLLSPILFFFPFIFISWRLITLQYCSGFCHTCVPHPDPPSHLPLVPIPLGLPSAPGPSTCLMHPTWAGDLFHPR